MILHIILLQPKEVTTEDTMETALEQVRALRSSLLGLSGIQVGKNQSPNHQGYTSCFTMRFVDASDLASALLPFAYQTVRSELERLCKSIIACDLVEVPPPPPPKLRDAISDKAWQQKTGEEKLKILLMDQLGVREEDLVKDASFVEDLNADSLDLVEIIMGIEEEFHITISDEDAEKITTVGEALDYLEEHSALQSSQNTLARNPKTKRGQKS